MQTQTLRDFSLTELAARLGGSVYGTIPPDRRISRVVVRSELAHPDCGFVAVKGLTHDGHDFVADAVSRGAAVAVVSSVEKFSNRNVPLIAVPDTRHALSQLASWQYGSPGATLRVIGITGTNGKTTTNWMLYHLLNLLGEKSLRMGTLGIAQPDRHFTDESLTTPDPLTLHSALFDAVAGGGKAAVLEVSSHALHQRRVEHLDFDVAVFTNLTRDHLDYHPDIESYFEAKRHLFTLLSASPKKTRAAVINQDCAYGSKILHSLESLNLRDFSFGRHQASTVRILDLAQRVSGSTLTLQYQDKTQEVHSNFIGAHNAYNVAAATAVILSLGISLKDCARLFREVPHVPGRLEGIGSNSGSGLRVFVDYAHSPDALERVLTCLKELTVGKLWVVFGCGGDRDKGKRPLMASVAASLADRIVVTSDNPRTEDPCAIIEDILSGPEGPELRRNGIVEADRRTAIATTLRAAGRDDVVLIAGKGHEQYQIVGTEKLHFSDQEEVRKYFMGHI